MASRGSKGTSTTITTTPPPDTSAQSSSSFLSRKKKEIVERSMALLTRSLDQCLDKGKRYRDEEEGEAGGCGGLVVGEQKGEDIGVGGRAKKKRVTSVKEGGSGRKFACPFCKHDPVKYRSVKTCCGPGWDDVHRVKEHVYRRHSLKNLCPRCFEHFEKPELLKQHQRADVACKVKEKGPSGITEEQEKELRARAKGGSSEETKWEEMYKIIFPGEKVPSPYYDTDSNSLKSGTSRFGSLEECKEFLRAEIPRLARPVIAQYVDKLMEEVQEKVNKHTVDILHDIETRVLRTFRFQEEQASTLPSLSSISPHGGAQVAQISSCAGKPSPPPSPRPDMSQIDELLVGLENDSIGQEVLSELQLSTDLDDILAGQAFGFDEFSVDSAYYTSSSNGVQGPFDVDSVGYGPRGY
ncbi:hypothetical protein VTI74DRAFT_9100 [Chaetomium olivicolor]